jgi:hypothetical protein
MIPLEGRINARNGIKIAKKANLLLSLIEII